MKTKFIVFAIVLMAITALAASPVSVGLAIKENSVKTRQSLPPAFSFFRTHRQGAGVAATWGMTSEQGIACYLVQRTYEDPSDPYAYWENICMMPCNVTRSYKHTDENVFAGFITYRVIAFLQFGGSMMTENSTEHIVGH